jgi:hypothetical protein
MPPKSRAPTDVLRGRGRPKRQEAPEPPPTTNAPTKRGRAAKADVVAAPAERVEPPKKRGRPSKVAAEEAVAVVKAPKRGRPSLIVPEATFEEGPAPKKRMGRPPKTQVVETPAETPKRRAGRPAKANATTAIAVDETPKRRGRPAKNAAVDLSRVAGSPRVTKSRARLAAKAATAPRIDPRVRSRLRTRVPAAQKVEKPVVAQPTRRRGRPATVKATPPTPVKAKATKTATTKPVAPRKKRGYTTLEVPDRFAARVQQYLQELQNGDALPTAIEGIAEEVAEQQEEEEVEEEEALEAEAGAEEDDEEEVEAETGTGEEDNEAEAEVVVEEDVEMTAEDDVLATGKGMGSLEDDNVMALSEGAMWEEDYAEMDQDKEAHEQEMDQDMDPHEQFIPDDEVEPIEEAPEVELEMNVQETVQIQLDADDAALAQQELDQELGRSLGSGDDESSLQRDNDTSAYVRNAEPVPSAGFLFGQGVLSH